MKNSIYLCNTKLNAKTIHFSFRRFLNFPQHWQDPHDPVPDSHERESEKKPESSPKLCQEGLKRKNEHFFLNLSVRRHRPEANWDLILWESSVVGFLLVQVDELILLVTARSPTTRFLHNFGQGPVGDCHVEFLERSEKSDLWLMMCFPPELLFCFAVNICVFLVPR